MKRKHKKLFIYIAFSLVISICLFILSIYDYVNADTPTNTYNNISGQFTTASVSQGVVDVDCGFAPDYIYVVLPFSSGDTYAIYDSSVSTTTSTWTIPQEQNTYTITLGSSSGETGICEVNQNGFKFRCNAANTRNVTCTFFARSGERVELLNVYINPVGVVSDSYNTVSNYNNYYDGASGSNKTDIVNTYSSNLNVTDLYNTINFDGTLATQYMFFDDLYSNFPYYNGNNINTYMALSYSDSENVFIVENICSSGNVWILGNHVYSDRQFWMSRTHYIPHNNNVDGQNIITFEYDRTVYVDGSNGYDGGIWTTSSGQITGVVFSDIPIYFVGDNNSSSDHQDIQYLNNCIITNDNDNGFVVDRRLYQYVPSDPDDNNGEIVKLNYDPELFNGVLGFNWFNPAATLNYNNHVNLYYPYFLFKYQINNYTDIHKTSCSLVIESSINLKLTYQNQNIQNSPKYFTIAHYQNNKEILLNDNLNNFTIYGSSQGSDSWSNTSLRSSAGIGSAETGHLQSFTGDLTSDIYKAINQYKNASHISYNDSYGLFIVRFYIKDNILGNTSEVYYASFDLYKNEVTDNKNDLVSNDNESFMNFVNSFDYQKNNDDYTPVEYANNVNSSGGSGGQSIVTITNPQFPYLLVDIPEGDWMNKTPNLTNILGDFKNALEEVHDESILPVMAETYSYLPADMWRYIVYGVELLLMIGIWRGITRR